MSARMRQELKPGKLVRPGANATTRLPGVYACARVLDGSKRHAPKISETEPGEGRPRRAGPFKFGDYPLDTCIGEHTRRSPPKRACTERIKTCVLSIMSLNVFS